MVGTWRGASAPPVVAGVHRGPLSVSSADQGEALHVRPLSIHCPPSKCPHGDVAERLRVLDVTPCHPPCLGVCSPKTRAVSHLTTVQRHSGSSPITRDPPTARAPAPPTVLCCSRRPSRQEAVRPLPASGTCTPQVLNDSRAFVPTPGTDTDPQKGAGSGFRALSVRVCLARLRGCSHVAGVIIAESGVSSEDRGQFFQVKSECPGAGAAR